MNRFGKIIFYLVIFAAAFALDLRAESVVATIDAEVAADHSAAAPLVSMSAPTLFNLFGLSWLPVTNSMICTWIVAGLILVIVRVTTWKLSEVPGRGQNVMEALIEGWQDLMGNVLEPKVVKWVFPFAMTFFIFIVISNLTDLLPGVGSIGFVHEKPGAFLSVAHVGTPFFRPPTSDANLTVAMAGIFFVMGLYWAVRSNGFWGLIKHTFGVQVETNKYAYVPLMLLFIFIGIMESFSILFIRPVALALRLYGNIFGGETMLTMAMSQKSVFMAILLALPGYFFETVVCLLQAFVFAMLSVAFVGTMCPSHDEEHSH
ncbi:MAG: F0F1 ATP synthase subunit A [Verrucomicrobiales bacterium]|nr:F0F1 ATP synthase subunit A [Verrucomicrobiales bacterium]